MRKSCRRLLRFGVAPLLGPGRWKDVVMMSLPLEHQRHCSYFDFLGWQWIKSELIIYGCYFEIQLE